MSLSTDGVAKDGYPKFNLRPGRGLIPGFLVWLVARDLINCANLAYRYRSVCTKHTHTHTVYGMFFACGIWCVADVSSVSHSSEQTVALWGNHYFNSWLLIYADRKVRFCHWLKLVASNWSKICLKLGE